MGGCPYPMINFRGRFSRANVRELVLFLVFLAVSACFWLMQALNETCEVNISVPLRVVDRPGDVIVLTEPPMEFTIAVQDKGLALWHYLLSPRTEPLTLTFDDVSADRTAAHVRIAGRQLWDSLSPRFPSSTRFLSVVKPDSVTLDYNRGQHTTLPARYAGVLTTAPHYALTSLSVTPATVKVYALDERRPRGDSVDVGQALRLTDLRQTGQTRIALSAPQGVSYSPDEVTLRYAVVPLVRHTLRIPVRQQNFPGGKALRTFPSHVALTYWALPADDTDAPLTPDSFFLSVTYDEVLRSREKLRPRLHVHPPSALDITLSPTEVDYVIEEVVDE